MAGGLLNNVAIVGVARAVPEAVRTVEDEGKIFGDAEIRRIAKNLGVDSRRVAGDRICASDLCTVSAVKLLDALDWDRSSVDAVIFVSVTPDYVMPATACTLQHRLGLSTSCAAFDITHACSGYIYGLWTAAHFIASGHARRVLLLAGDTPSRLVSPEDRAVAALFGDAGTATALEWSEAAQPMGFDLGTDGSGAANLIVKAGGFRTPRTADTAVRREQEGGNIRSEEDLYMNGTEVFAFTLREVPALNRRVLARAGWELDSVDAWVMHQANAFILKYLAKSMKLPADKVVLDMAEYGNTSVATMPMVMAGALRARLVEGPLRLVLLGFGTGLSWGGASLTCGPLVIPELITVSEKILDATA
jgi:3-oxoacyl-[acyl-carrier-protein] synthase III